VFMNGLLLDLTVDYTSNGSAVTLTSGAAAGDEIEVVAYNTFSVGDALNQAAADTRYVNSTGDTMTGDLTVDTNTFHVDVADNRVGIGTSTPDMGKLQINEDAAASTAIFIRNRHNVAGTHSDITFGYGEASNSYGAGIRFRQVDTTHGGQIELYTDSASGAYTKQMQITENGYVTKPNTPHLNARGYSANASGTDRATFSSIARNNGNHYNNTTGNFTCPVAGTYHVTAFSGYKAADGYLGMGIGKNGSVYQYGWSSQNSNHAHATQCSTAIIDAAANDTFYYYVNANAAYVKPNSGVGYSAFSIYLLG